MVKEGDKYKDRETNKIYVIKAIHTTEILLVGENGFGRKLTNVKSLEYTCEKLGEVSSSLTPLSDPSTR